ncbi:putative 2-haloalkanoic acid dehalogenase [Aspergillus novofumigatus IBT 16806]|uniref:Putative haloacid dehalogenase-like hydrolase n=1 Tax=Aspergillus novofumigatus (strain IBT 16806) TaxID=1392255 RepID=A0A2I1C0E7_ASPN1|nr:putative haloacid dehalogenase-like hydrolase [Aspergillus novofumigatus IBT 16806]PKX91097.1 putative haloacid dehalogenase-like hydrolase [Aspergillus novofumigatus IBT 16806]
MRKHIIFDVVGTCVSFDAYFASIAATIGPKLSTYNITPNHFGYTWMTAAELEFTFLSISESYRPYKDVMRALFYRSLFMAGVADPRSVFTDEERDACIAGYASLQLRPELGPAFEKLRNAGFEVWCLTTGDVERGGVEMPVERVLSCDGLRVAKPALGAYRAAIGKIGADDEKWFAAAHLWDVSAAVRAGFRGREGCWEVFDRESLEVVADGLVEMVEGVIKISG